LEGSEAAGFAAASEFFVACIRRVPPDVWESPGLGSWTVRQLVAHGNRAHTTLIDYVTHPQAPEPATSSYFTAEAIEARAVEAVAALGDDPARAVADFSAEAVALVGRSPADTPVGGPAGTVTLADYLPSRTAELTLHGMDVLAAIDMDEPAPSAALSGTLDFVVRHATRKGVADQLLRAATGRGSLPPDFSVY
jgi:uncharacterized protein (TIGR03083 family)